MAKGDRVARLRERLATIALQDTAIIIETNRAMRKMSDLGYSPEHVRKLLTDSPVVTVQLDGKPLLDDDGRPFFGFDSRRQASLAAFGGMAKKDRPGALGDVHDRVNSLIKNQEPERAGGTIGLAVISIPALANLGAQPDQVQRFRRLKSGRLREITAAEEDGAIDLPEEAVESTVVVRERKTED